METRQHPGDARSLWQSQRADPLVLPTASIRRKAGEFQRTIRRRNLGEYLASVFVIAVFGWQALTADGIAARVGPALMVFGTLFIVWRLYSQGSARSLPPEAMADTCVTFYRREMERQHRLVSTVWRWYLGPLVPGLTFMMVQSAVARPDTPHLWKLGGFAAFCVLLMLAIGKANQMAARQLAKEIAVLEAER